MPPRPWIVWAYLGYSVVGVLYDIVWMVVRDRREPRHQRASSIIST